MPPEVLLYHSMQFIGFINSIPISVLHLATFSQTKKYDFLLVLKTGSLEETSKFSKEFIRPISLRIF
jgi:hypothetical protein